MKSLIFVLLRRDLIGVVGADGLDSLKVVRDRAVDTGYMRIVPAVEAEIRREIRDARTIDPLIGFAELEQRLEKKFKRSFSYRYIAKLADKIAPQAFIEADRTQIEDVGLRCQGR
jgi:hypothetical protein